MKLIRRFALFISKKNVPPPSKRPVEPAESIKGLSPQTREESRRKKKPERWNWLWNNGPLAQCIEVPIQTPKKCSRVGRCDPKLCGPTDSARRHGLRADSCRPSGASAAPSSLAPRRHAIKTSNPKFRKKEGGEDGRGRTLDALSGTTRDPGDSWTFLIAREEKYNSAESIINKFVRVFERRTAAAVDVSPK